MMFRPLGVLLLLAAGPLLAGDITGNVKDATTTANLPGATVTVTGPGNTATTDASGNYTLTNVPAGTYTVIASMASYLPRQTSLAVPASGALTWNASLTQAGTFTGTIVSTQGGTPVSGVTVAGPGGTTTTDASGNFSVLLQAGSRSLTLSKTGWVTRTVGPYTAAFQQTVSAGTQTLTQFGTLTGTVKNVVNNTNAVNVKVTNSLGTVYTNTSGVFTLNADPTNPALTLGGVGNYVPVTLNPTFPAGQTTNLGTINVAQSVLTGTVVNAVGGTPVAGATVTTNGTSTTATTDAAGNFTISLNAATVTITVAKTGFANATKTNVVASLGATVSVGSITLTPYTILSGTVINASGGAPVPTVTVTYSGLSGSVATASNGFFTRTLAAGGTFTLTLTKTGWNSVTAGPFTIATGQTLDVGTISMTQQMGRVAGVVIDSQGGAPVPGATVTVNLAGVSGTTNEAGIFDITSGVGSYTLTVTKPTWQAKTTTAIVISQGIVADAGYISLTQVGTVTGTVVRSDTAAPLASVTVKLTGSNPVLQTTTNASGVFTLANVPVGTRTLDFTKTGYAAPTTAPFTVTGGSTVNLGNIPMDQGTAVGGNYVSSQTWYTASSPYIVTSAVTFPAGVTLAIQPGVVVKFSAGTSLTAPGMATLTGTPASPITFTSRAASPAPGDWGPLSVSTANFSYVTVAYGGGGTSLGALMAYNGNLDHVTFSSSATKGFYATSSIPKLTSCTFTGNQTAASTASGTLSARLNYWGSPSGPSGSGPGTGQPISTNVDYEPWLIGAPSTGNYFTSFTVTGRTFDGTSGTATLSFATSQAAAWTATIRSSTDAVVRTLTGSGATGTAIWDGKDAGSVLQPDGIYSYTVDSVGATSVKGYLVLDNYSLVTLTNIAVSQAFFSPNNNGVQDTTTLTATTGSAGNTWTVDVKNGAGDTIRTATGTGSTSISFVWDGKSSSGILQSDGSYTFAITVTGGGSTVTGTASTVIDNTPPTALITSPTNGQVLSNFLLNGQLLNLQGVATDANFNYWDLYYPGAHTVGNAPVSAGTVSSIDLYTIANGAANFTLYVFDKAGNQTNSSVNVTVADFRVTSSVYQLSAVAGQTITYTSVLPFPMTETLYIKNQSGQVVHTVFNGARPAGTFTDTWNGKTTGGELLADGAYFFIASVTDGTNGMTLDLTNQFLNDWSTHAGTLVSDLDPYAAKPLVLSYNFPVPSRISIILGPASAHVDDSCASPQLCLVYDKYEESGPHTISWAGVDSTGTLRTDLQSYAAVSRRDKFAKNAVVLYGAAPVITNLSLSPSVLPAPGTGTTLTFDVASPAAQPADITVTFLNQESMSVLQTITGSIAAPGHVTIPWDGLAANGMPVAPGLYTVTVTALSPLGNQAQSQSILRVEF